MNACEKASLLETDARVPSEGKCDPPRLYAQKGASCNFKTRPMSCVLYNRACHQAVECQLKAKVQAISSLHRMRSYLDFVTYLIDQLHRRSLHVFVCHQLSVDEGDGFLVAHGLPHSVAGQNKKAVGVRELHGVDVRLRCDLLPVVPQASSLAWWENLPSAGVPVMMQCFRQRVAHMRKKR